MSEVSVKPTYAAIESLRDICEPWIALYQGDEWGDSMWQLHGASVTSHGMSDEDCAIVVALLWRNIEIQKDWADQDGWSNELVESGGIANAQAKASEARSYWLKGGNLGDFANTIADAKETIDQLPGWVFGEEKA